MAGRFEVVWVWRQGAWEEASEASVASAGGDLWQVVQRVHAQGGAAHRGFRSIGPPDGEPVAGCCFPADDEARP